MTTHRTPPSRHAHRGFTLAEVMFAVMILGLGLLGVASLFPVAGSLQRDTVDRIVGVDLTRTAENVMLAKGVPATAFPATPSTSLAPVPSLETHIPIADRVYPTLTAAEATAAAGGDQAVLSKITHYWFPLYRYDTNKGFQFFVFICRRTETDTWVNMRDGTYIQSSGNSNAGELGVVGSTGQVQTIITDNSAGGGVWRAVPAGPVSRFINLAVVGEGVIR